MLGKMVVLFSIGAFSAHLASNLIQPSPPSVREILDAWQSWSTAFDQRGGVKVDVYFCNWPNARLEPSAELEKAGEYLTLAAGAKRLHLGKNFRNSQKPYVFRDLVNNEYNARIVETESSAWLLDSVNSPGHYVNEPLPSHRMYAMRPSIRDWLKDDKIIEIKANDKGGWTLRLNKPTDGYLWIEIDLGKETNWKPLRCTFAHSGDQQWPFTEEKYTFEIREGRSELTQIDTRVFSPSRDVEHIIGRIEFEYMNDRKPKRNECYLSYYGLPEPKYARSSNRWWYAGGAVLFALVAIGAWRRFRSRH